LVNPGIPITVVYANHQETAYGYEYPLDEP